MPIASGFYCEAVSWHEAAEHLTSIRKTVFIDEQQVSKTEEWDGLDLKAQHFLLYTESTVAVGCARVLCEPAAWHIGRVAILKPWRLQGAGSALMRAVAAWCIAEAPYTLYLHAQVQVTGFYQKLGFSAYGDIFMDAGIPHIAMRHSIKERE